VRSVIPRASNPVLRPPINQLIGCVNRRTYYVYIMSSVSRTIYTGVTNNPERRVAEHKERRPGSFTARHNIDRLVYFEEFDDINQAIIRESEIKHMAR
jgi:putative endonuclease